MRAGYATLRVTHRQAEREAAAVADTIAAQLRVWPASRKLSISSSDKRLA